MTPEELADQFQSGAFAKMKERIMQRVTAAALRRSQPKTPYRTGRLVRSEEARIEDGGARGFLESDVEYAPFQHARIPFFAEGIDEAAGSDIPQILQDEGDSFWGEISR
jgi:hypothetical protein